MNANPITVERLKADYPAPVRSSSVPEDAPGSRCVGGILCAATGTVNVYGTQVAFPDRRLLGEALRAANPNLTHGHAASAAAGIIVHNDLGRFDRAWEILDNALKFENPTNP